MLRLTTNRAHKGLSKFGLYFRDPADTRKEVNKSHHDRVVRIYRNDKQQPAVTRALGTTIINQYQPAIFTGGRYMQRKLGYGGNHGKKGKSVRRKPLRSREIDTIRCMSHIESNFEEKVLRIEEDSLETGYLALVSGNYPHARNRWIIAPHTLSVGDVIKTVVWNPDNISEKDRLTNYENGFLKIKSADQLKQGDAYPLGSLPIGTSVCLIAPEAHQDSMFSKIYAREAGSHLFVFKQFPEEMKTMCYYPSMKRTVEFSNTDIATIGRVSNPGHLRKAVKPMNVVEKMYLGRAFRGQLWSHPDARHARTRPDESRTQFSLLPSMYTRPVDTTLIRKKADISGPDEYMRNYNARKNAARVDEIKKTKGDQEKELLAQYCQDDLDLEEDDVEDSLRLK